MTPADPAPGRVRAPSCELPCFQWFCATLSEAQPAATEEIEELLQEAAALASSASVARQTGDETAADAAFRRALSLATAVFDRPGAAAAPWRGRVARAAACLALNCGEVAQARRLVATAWAEEGGADATAAWAQLRDPAAWPDAWLVAAIRGDPPDEGALDALANRYWKPLFGRCELLTLHHQKAADLAQEAWRRVLRTRHALKPGGNFPAYLNTTATNIWRDWHRSARRAGALAEDRLASLDAAMSTEEGGGLMLGEVIPDLNALDAEKQRQLMLDIDHALERLAPHLREALVARFLNGESCAEIGRRHGRTEQTISGWVREAVRGIRQQLQTAECGVNLPNEST